MLAPLRNGAALAIGFGVPCPLTTLENEFRIRAGEAAAYQVSFIGYWLDRLLYYTAPAWVFTTIYTAFSLLVVLTFVFYPPRWNKPAS